MKVRALTLCLAMMGFGTAHAASVSYFLDQSNVLPDGVNYLKVTIDDEGLAGAINFSVDALDAAFNPSSNFGIQAFAFNGGTLLDLDGDITLPIGWKLKGEKNVSEFGEFDNVLKGKGNKRKDPLSFSVMVDGDDISTYTTPNEDGFLFAARVAGFTSEGRYCAPTSGWFAGGNPAPVPVPAAMWLMGSGLLGLVGVARRRNKT